MSKTAVVLMNLGGPDSLQAVKPFLYNLFSDPAIFRLPAFLRIPLAKFVSSRRTEKATGIYEKMGGKSPILELTQAQAQALEASLNEEKSEDEYKVFIAMRYWHPLSEHTVLQVKYWKPEHVILLPLYPQFSSTTTDSSIKQWKKECKKVDYDPPTKAVCCYPFEQTFIEAHVKAIAAVYNQAKQSGKPRILFSAHGLPEKVIKDGDPYQWQVEETTRAVMQGLRIPQLDYTICYQSRVGPLKWIGPNTESEIERGAKDGVPLIVVPIAFVSEHSETLVELDIEYKELFDHHGGKHYFRVGALGTDTGYIDALKQMCLRTKNHSACAPNTGARICPAAWKNCPSF